MDKAELIRVLEALRDYEHRNGRLGCGPFQEDFTAEAWEKFNAITQREIEEDNLLKHPHGSSCG